MKAPGQGPRTTRVSDETSLKPSGARPAPFQMAVLPTLRREDGDIIKVCQNAFPKVLAQLTLKVSESRLQTQTEQSWA